MIQNRAISALALAVSLGWAMPAHAQSAADFTKMKAQMEAMQAQLDAMKSKVDTLEGQLTQAQAAAQNATAAAQIASVTAQSASVSAVKATEIATKTAEATPKIAWKGAPEFTSKDGLSFKPRGRLQVDVAGVNGPSGINSKSLGYGTELRRAYLGFEGTLPGNFGYRAEVDVANSAVDITDLYLTYKPKPELTLTIGQHKPFWGLEELTSDLFTSFQERAAFNSAFGFERRVGASAAYVGKSIVVQGGVFADNAADLNNDTNNSYSSMAGWCLCPKSAAGSFISADRSTSVSSTTSRPPRVIAPARSSTPPTFAWSIPGRSAPTAKPAMARSSPMSPGGFTRPARAIGSPRTARGWPIPRSSAAMPSSAIC